MKIEGFIEISEGEYEKLSADEGLKFDDAYNQKTSYFKKTQEFPIVFPFDSGYKIEVDDIGDLYFIKHGKCTFVLTNKAIPILYQAVMKSKEMMKK